MSVQPFLLPVGVLMMERPQRPVISLAVAVQILSWYPSSSACGVGVGGRADPQLVVFAVGWCRDAVSAPRGRWPCSSQSMVMDAAPGDDGEAVQLVPIILYS